MLFHVTLIWNDCQEKNCYRLDVRHESESVIRCFLGSVVRIFLSTNGNHSVLWSVMIHQTQTVVLFFFNMPSFGHHLTLCQFLRYVRTKIFFATKPLCQSSRQESFVNRPGALNKDNYILRLARVSSKLFESQGSIGNTHMNPLKKVQTLVSRTQVIP